MLLELTFSEYEIVTTFFPQNHHERKWQCKLLTYPLLVTQNTIIYCAYGATQSRNTYDETYYGMVRSQADPAYVLRLRDALPVCPTLSFEAWMIIFYSHYYHF